MGREWGMGWVIVAMLAGCGGAGVEAVEPGGDGAGMGWQDMDVSRPLPCPPGFVEGTFGPVMWTAQAASERWMHDERQVSRVRSSPARPVEVCGVDGQILWLMQLRCPDGRPPYRDPTTAHESRAGNVGAGGRCGTIIDLYPVPCSDGVHEIYIDLYHCAPGEAF
ncbi:MAG: hypothetical protein HY905_02900 [Deltaproteobacteria bacterium]|nr:hypothetical protein [Deltaproteobacteria bacterium]